MTTLLNGLVAYYKLDETSGTTAVDSTGTNNGTINGATINQIGKIGNSFYFDGSGDQVNLGTTNSFSGNASRTYNIWFKVSSKPSSPVVLIGQSDGTCSDSHFDLQLTGTYLYFHGCGAGNDFSGGITYSIDTWYMASVTHDSSTNVTKLWFNGSEVGTQTNSRNTSGSATTYLAYEPRDNRYYSGYLDEVGIWDRALSQSEIEELFNNNSGNQYPFGNPKPKYSIFDNAVAYYDFSKNALDVIGENNGTVSGATLTTNRLNEVNSAYSFDGTNDYMLIADTGNKFVFNSNTEFSISFWMYRTTSGSSQMIVTKKTSNQGHSVYSIFSYSDDKILFQIAYESGSNENFYSTTTLANNTWYHVVCTAKYNDTRKIYINGVEDASVSFGTFDIGGGTLQANPFTIGGYSDLNGGWFGGKLSEVMIFNKQLSSDEVKQLYDLSKNKVIYPVVKGWRD